MTDKDTPAQADDKPVRKAKPKRVEAELITVSHATGSNPAMLIEGTAAVDTVYTAYLPNGIAYSGVVAETQDHESGKTLVTFRDGIEVAK